MFCHWLECNGTIFSLVGYVSATSATYTSNRNNDRVLFTYTNGVITDPNGNIATSSADAENGDETTPALSYLNWPANLYVTVAGTAITLDNIHAMLPRDYHFYWLYHDDAAVGTAYAVYQPMLGTFQVFQFIGVANHLEYLAPATTTAPV